MIGDFLETVVLRPKVSLTTKGGKKSNYQWYKIRSAFYDLESAIKKTLTRMDYLVFAYRQGAQSNMGQDVWV